MSRTTIEILSRREAERRTFTRNEVVVSISSPTSPGYPGSTPPVIRGARDVLRLWFDDAEPLAPELEVERTEAWGRPVALLDPADALEIIAFAKDHARAGRSIVVHCEAGISRSAGVAVALDLILHGDIRCLSGGRFMPNAHVKSVMLRAAGMHPQEDPTR